jgi:hypothetical protein
LEVQALARPSAPVAARLALCERSRKLAQGSQAAELSLQLTEAALYLEANDADRALESARQLREAFAKQESEYSVFRAAVIEASAMKRLGVGESDAAARATAALARFQSRFDGAAWVQFKRRTDFGAWEKRLRQRTP